MSAAELVADEARVLARVAAFERSEALTLPPDCPWRGELLADAARLVAAARTLGNGLCSAHELIGGVR